MSRYFHVESWSNAYKLRFVVCCNKLVNFVILYIFYYSLFCYYVYLCWIKLIMWVTWPTSSDPLVDDNRCYKSYTDAMGNRLYGNYVVLLFYLQLEKYIQYCVTKNRHCRWAVSVSRLISEICQVVFLHAVTYTWMWFVQFSRPVHSSALISCRSYSKH